VTNDRSGVKENWSIVVSISLTVLKMYAFNTNARDFP
jgi:hypothetical protein